MIFYTDYSERTQEFESVSITVIKENGDGTAVEAMVSEESLVNNFNLYF